MDALTRVLVGLYEEIERPANPIDFFLEHLSSGVPMKAELDALREEMTDMQTKVRLKYMPR
jgi:hypothetical protein